MIAETTTQAAGSHGCPVHGMGGWSGVALPEQAGFFMAGKAWPDQDSSGVLGQDTERLARHGLDWPRDSRTAGQAWQGPQWSGYSRIGRQAWSGVDRRRLARICRHGATWTTSERRGSAGMATQGRAMPVPARQAWHGCTRLRLAGPVMALQAWHGIAPRGGVRLAWICIAAIGWDCPGAAGMARWACNVAAGMDRHDQVGVQPRGRHGVARSGCASAASQAWDGLALQGLALRGWFGSSWQRFARLALAGMAANATTW